VGLALLDLDEDDLGPVAGDKINLAGLAAPAPGADRAA